MSEEEWVSFTSISETSRCSPQMRMPWSGSTLEGSFRNLVRWERISDAISWKSRSFCPRTFLRTFLRPSMNSAWRVGSYLKSSGDPSAVRMPSSETQKSAHDGRGKGTAQVLLAQVIHAPGSLISLKCCMSHVLSLQIPPASS